MASPPYAEKLAGLVSPDTVAADKATGKIKKVDIAEKTINEETGHTTKQMFFYQHRGVF